MKQLRFLIAFVVASILIGGVAPQAATASDTTGAITVMLMSPAKAKVNLGGVNVTVTSADGSVRLTGTTSAAGRLTFSGVPAGTGYTVSAYPASPLVYVGEQRAGVTITAGGHLWQVVTMRIGGVVSGHATIQSGADLSNADVVATGKNTGAVVHTTTNNAGNYRLSALPTDSYRIEYNARVGYPHAHTTLSHTWGFWGDELGQPARQVYLPVAAEQDRAPSSVIAGIDGQVDEGFNLTVLINPQGTTNFRNAVAYIVSPALGGSFETRVNASGGYFTEIVVAGSYKIKIVGISSTGQPIDYWYTGEARVPSHDASAATSVLFDGARHRSITFIRTP